MALTTWRTLLLFLFGGNPHRAERLFIEALVAFKPLAKDRGSGAAR